ncbi:MAG TPA: hypothetical protein VGS21_03575 [Acidimicrobiales bacterium]|nr:hypothetical protein [Acidimicrobiales bacterium]
MAKRIGMSAAAALAAAGMTMAAVVVAPAGAGATTTSGASGRLASATGSPLSQNVLNGVSCTSTTFCMAVGDYTANPFGKGVEPYAFTWDGASWTRHWVPRPAGIDAGYLTAVSCTSPRYCLLAGWGSSKTEDESLVYLWNGTAFTATPTPGADGIMLNAASCSSDDSCVVAGMATTNGQAGPAYAANWNGKRWHSYSIPNPPGGSFADIYSVSCDSSRSCEAVGGYQNARIQERPLAVSWDGHRWAPQALPPITGLHDSTLYGVSCTSGGCLAVGNYQAGTSPSVKAMALRFDGDAWLQDNPPVHGIGGAFVGVSCTATTWCLAAGDSYPSPTSFRPTTEVLGTSGWTSDAHPVTFPGRTDNEDYVSCVSSTFCMDVGQSFSNRSAVAWTLAEEWNGSTWAVTPTQNG